MFLGYNSGKSNNDHHDDDDDDDDVLLILLSAWKLWSSVGVGMRRVPLFELIQQS